MNIIHMYYVHMYTINTKEKERFSKTAETTKIRKENF